MIGGRPDEEEENFVTPEKEARFRQAMAGGPWYASCQSGHSIWMGPDRQTEAEARSDANTHDANRHGGTVTALVLNG